MKIKSIKMGYAVKVGRHEDTIHKSDKTVIELVSIRLPGPNGEPGQLQQVIRFTPRVNTGKDGKALYDPTYSSLLNVAWWMPEEAIEDAPLLSDAESQTKEPEDDELPTPARRGRPRRREA